MLDLAKSAVDSIPAFLVADKDSLFTFIMDQAKEDAMAFAASLAAYLHV